MNDDQYLKPVNVGIKLDAMLSSALESSQQTLLLVVYW